MMMSISAMKLFVFFLSLVVSSPSSVVLAFSPSPRGASCRPRVAFRRPVVTLLAAEKEDGGGGFFGKIKSGFGKTEQDSSAVAVLEEEPTAATDEKAKEGAMKDVALSHPVSVALAAEKEEGGGGFFGKIKNRFSKKEQDDSAVAVLDEEPATATDEKGGEGAVKDDEEEKKDDKAAKGFKAIREAGKAGSISLFLWEAAFWIIAVPIVTFGYRQTTGHFPDFTDQKDLGILGAEVVAFANAARFALPLRIGLAVTTIPWVQDNIVDRFWPEAD